MLANQVSHAIGNLDPPELVVDLLAAHLRVSHVLGACHGVSPPQARAETIQLPDS